MSDSNKFECKKLFPYVMQFLYYYRFSSEEKKSTAGVNMLFREFNLSLGQEYTLEPDLEISAKAKIEGIIQNKEELISMIAPKLLKRSFESLYDIDQTILLIGCFELKKDNSAPPRALVIDSMVELAKKFSTQKAPSFLNGVLDNL